jgi:hypothetical protein
MKSQFADGVGLAVSFGIVSDDLEEWLLRYFLRLGYGGGPHSGTDWKI